MKNISRVTSLLMAVFIVSHSTVEPIKLPSKKTGCKIVGSILAIAGIGYGIHILYKMMDKKNVCNGSILKVDHVIPLEGIVVEEIPPIFRLFMKGHFYD